MTKTISEIKSFLDDLKIHYTEREDESRSCISVTSQRKDGSTYTLYMISNKDYDLMYLVLINQFFSLNARFANSRSKLPFGSFPGWQS